MQMTTSLRFITFHYRRENEDYDGWMLHAYCKGSTGIDFIFEPDIDNPGYVMCKIKIELIENFKDKFWFKLHKNMWNEVDCHIPRIISIPDLHKSENLDIYVRNHHTKYYYEKPKLLHTKVNINYYRYDNDYENWQAQCYIDEKNNFQRYIKGFEKNEGDWPFHKISFGLDYEENQSELDFLLRRNSDYDCVDFRKVPLSEGFLNIYVVQDIYDVAVNRTEAMELLRPRILRAIFDNPGDHISDIRTIWVELNRPLTDKFIHNKKNFCIRSIDDSLVDDSLVDVAEVEFTDKTKRRLKIVLSENSIDPYCQKYNLTIGEVSPDTSFRFDTPFRVSVQRLYDRPEFVERFVFDNKAIEAKLGCQHTTNKTEFLFWSPYADKVNINIYDDGLSGIANNSIPMSSNDGLWTTTILGEDSTKLNNKFYTYEIVVNDQAKEIMDPYAISCGLNAKRSAIIDLSTTNPNGWDCHTRPLGKLKHPIIYEMSVRDFTDGIDSQVTPAFQGKFKGIVEKIDHFKSLGINAIQLLPVTKFASDEAKDNKGGYNWGYDQLGYWFVPEGIYCTKPKDPLNRIIEFKEMIKACHENGIRVIIDAVHNHTYQTEHSVLNESMPSYYYRTVWDDSFSNGSGCGNETKSERPMTSKLIREYLKYWVEEMGVDGFRFDLMSLTDKFTMQQIRKDINSVNPDVMIYGEAYYMGWSIAPPYLQASKANMNQPELDGIGAFTDIGSRNAIRGYNYETGLATGAHVNSRASELFNFGQKGEFIDLTSRNNCTSKVYNYIDVHDDLLLYDFLTAPDSKMSDQEIIKRYKLAYSMLFNYIGAVVIKSGVEALHTKFWDYNSYRSEDVNIFNWAKLKDYPEILNYFCQYIHFRKSHPAYMMSRKDVSTKFEVFDSHGGIIKGKMFKDHANGDPLNKILIFHNLSTDNLTVNLPFESSGWSVLANGERAGNTRIGSVSTDSIEVPSLTTLVLCDNKSLKT